MILFTGKRLSTLWATLTIWLSALVISNSAIYFLEGNTPAFLLEKGDVSHLPIWRAAFYFHVVGACVCLVTGAPLMFPTLLRYRVVHRLFGFIYIISVLFVAGPAALIMTPFAKGGLLGVLGFAVAGSLWWWFTMDGYLALTLRDYAAHKRAMVRSYAVATSALSFRVYQMAFFFAGMADEPNYIVSLWLSLATSIWLSETRIERDLRPRRPAAVTTFKGTVS